MRIYFKRFFDFFNPIKISLPFANNKFPSSSKTPQKILEKFCYCDCFILENYLP